MPALSTRKEYLKGPSLLLTPAITAVMISSAVLALLIGASADRSQWSLLPILLIYAEPAPADSGIDVGHGDGRRSRLSRGHDGNASDGRVQPLRVGGLGHRHCTGRRRRPAKFLRMAAFSVLAARASCLVPWRFIGEDEAGCPARR